MKTTVISIFITFFTITSLFSQASLNDYKYIIVAKKFDFLNEADQYQMNSLAQFLLNKYGFVALKEGEGYPEDLKKNRCLAMKMDVYKDSGLFKTKLKGELKDCNDQLVYETAMGESREKEYAKAYNEALREAFKSFEALNYRYKPKAVETVTDQPVQVKSEVAQEIQKLREELETLKKEKEVEVVQTSTSVIKEADVVPVQVQEIESAETIVKEALSSVLYAQQIENGYQLVDSSPKVVYRIKNSGLNNVFLVEGKNAIVYKKGDSWVLEYYSENNLKQEALNIKF